MWNLEWVRLETRRKCYAVPGFDVVRRAVPSSGEGGAPGPPPGPVGGVRGGTLVDPVFLCGNLWVTHKVCVKFAKRRKEMSVTVFLLIGLAHTLGTTHSAGSRGRREIFVYSRNDADSEEVGLGRPDGEE